MNLSYFIILSLIAKYVKVNLYTKTRKQENK